MSPFSQESTESMYKKARETEEKYKQKAKIYTDNVQKRTKASRILVGDKVLLKSKTNYLNKSQPVFDPEPFTVKKLKGNQVSAESSASST